MRITWRGEAANLSILAAIAVVAAYGWVTLPDRVPVHWNASGQIDRYGSKLEGLLLVPLLAIALYAVLLVAPRIDPGRANYARFAGSYATMRLAILAFLAVVYAAIVISGAGAPLDVPTVVGLAIGALLVLLGNLMGKVRPNWFVGIRTPWTLSSTRSWDQTHRLGGWLFIAMGVAIALALPSRSPVALVAAFAFGLVCTIVLVAYSYVVWRADPHKVPPSGTEPAEGS